MSQDKNTADEIKETAKEIYNNDYDLYVEALKEFNEKQKDSD